MKIFKLMAIALVAMLGFSSCSEDCDHEFIEYDYSNALVGTWTILEEGQAEAMVINPDGSFEVTGVMKGGNGGLYEEKGTIKVVNNKVTLAYNSGDVFEGRLELVAGKSLSIVLFEEENIRLTYDYCKEDLSDEVVGMWVCTDGPMEENDDMLIQTFNADGTSIMTGITPAGGILGIQNTYKVIGDLLFGIMQEGSDIRYSCARIVYSSNGTTLGDVMTHNSFVITEDFEVIKNAFTWLRVKEGLNLNGKTYDYSSAYVTNAKGKDEDFTILGHTFNIANITGGNFDMFFRSELYNVEVSATSIKQKFHPNGEDVEVDVPITVDGNKVTLDMSAGNPAFRKVDMYMYQDADDSQLHIYMPTSSFINYFANLEITTMLIEGKIDTTDTAAVEKVFADMEARVESINVSFVFKARK